MRSVRMLAVLTAAAVLLAVAPVRVAARPAEPVPATSRRGTGSR